MSNKHLVLTVLRMFLAGYLTIGLFCCLYWGVTDQMPSTLAEVTFLQAMFLPPLFIALTLCAMIVVVLIFLIFYKLLGGD